MSVPLHGCVSTGSADRVDGGLEPIGPLYDEVQADAPVISVSTIEELALASSTVGVGSVTAEVNGGEAAGGPGSITVSLSISEAWRGRTGEYTVQVDEALGRRLLQRTSHDLFFLRESSGSNAAVARTPSTNAT